MRITPRVCTFSALIINACMHTGLCANASPTKGHHHSNPLSNWIVDSEHDGSEILEQKCTWSIPNAAGYMAPLRLTLVRIIAGIPMSWIVYAH